MSERQRSYERKEITAAHTELRQDSLQKELKLHDEMLQSALIDEKNIDSYFQNAFLSDNAQNDSYRHR